MSDSVTKKVRVCKIAHVIIGLGIGGAELMLKRLVTSEHADKNYQHTVISLTTLGKIGPQLQELGIEVYALDTRSIFSGPRTMFRLLSLMHKSRFDIVQTWMYHADLVGGVAARLLGKRHVIWGIRTTDAVANNARTTNFIRKLCARLSSWVPEVIVCAAEASKLSHSAIGYDASRMVVIPNGFDFSLLTATAEERATFRLQLNLGSELVVVGYLGRFHYTKDQGNFVRAAGLVAQRHKNVRFLMVGRNLDTGNAELMRWIEATGQAERFILLGERTDVSICLASMDMFCLSSRTEGFPNVVGEAMAMGVPCVVTDVGDAAMLVADTGVVVPKENREALAQGLEQLLEMSPDMRRLLGQKARARIQAEFTIERACERFEAVYQGMIKGEKT